MAEIYDINVDQLRSFCPKLRAGDKVLLSGCVYTARDAAHKRFEAMLDRGEELPVELRDAVIYYAGPTPAPEGKPIGS
ncbi:MAG: fumarate hydratase C-terminal domain-containing protein, partial [Oscillospiraceae bacterium]|nr:fumarate hydratase C-terminal domain-containing protein [Oscillospiraceae bacterium]